MSIDLLDTSFVLVQHCANLMSSSFHNYPVKTMAAPVYLIVLFQTKDYRLEAARAPDAV
jgi:hypothetical protein